MTVILPTRDRPDDLRAALASLCGQDYPEFEVVVMDQSDDAASTRSVVEALGDARFTYVEHTRRGKSLALNDAIATSTARIIAFTDDDCEAPADWISRGVDVLEHEPSLGIVFGDVTAAPHDPTAVWIPAIGFDAERTVRGPVTRHRDLLGMGANMFIRRAAIDALGSFDEDLGPGGPLGTGEESEFVYRLLQDGRFALRQDPSLQVLHHGARPIADDVAQRHVEIADHALAAGLGKHLRARDRGTLRVIGDQLWWRVRKVAGNVVRLRRPFGLGYLTTFSRGLVAGWRCGPNWHSPST